MVRYWQDFFRKNGPPLAIYLLISVTCWMLLMIVLPQIFLLDFNRKRILPRKTRGNTDCQDTNNGNNYYQL